MLSAAARRLYVTEQASSHFGLFSVDSLKCSGLVAKYKFTSLGPSERKIMNNTVGRHHLVNEESQESCANRNQLCKKNVKNVFAYIL